MTDLACCGLQWGAGAEASVSNATDAQFDSLLGFLSTVPKKGASLGRQHGLQHGVRLPLALGQCTWSVCRLHCFKPHEGSVLGGMLCDTAMLPTRVFPC